MSNSLPTARPLIAARDTPSRRRATHVFARHAPHRGLAPLSIASFCGQYIIQAVVDGTKLSPYPSCGLAHPLELASFVRDGKAISNDRRGKAALRAERQAFQRHKAACFRNATNEVFRRLRLPPLGADRSENHHLVVRDVPQRCKRARPLIVVFEEKPRGTDALENRPGDR